MVKEKEPGVWSQKTRISTFLLVFDIVQDNYYGLNNDNNNCLTSVFFLAGITLRKFYTWASQQAQETGINILATFHARKVSFRTAKSFV